MQEQIGLFVGYDGRNRCWWCQGATDYQVYHDQEWGRPVTDDRRLFEKICLESFQAGLSWLTVLRKRKRLRKVFRQFDFEKVARFGEADIQRLLADPGIIRNRKKIESTINNAQRACELVEREGSLTTFLWKYRPPEAERPNRIDYAAVAQLSQTSTSKRLSADLKKLGFSFVGPTTMYALMQATGIVNDHLEGCALRAPVEQLRQDFLRSD